MKIMIFSILILSVAVVGYFLLTKRNRKSKVTPNMRIIEDTGQDIEDETQVANEAINAVEPKYHDGLPDSAFVDFAQWIEIMNVNGIPNGNRKFKFGDEGVIEQGGLVRLIKSVDAHVLVSYTSPYQRTGGTQCPTGAIFFLEKEKYATMTQRYHDGLDKIKAQKETIIALTQGQ